MTSSRVVVYDACVLYPAPLRDLLLWLGLSGLFRARWTDQIHQEWQRNLLANRPNIIAESLQRTERLMNTAIPDALIHNYDDLILDIHLPDKNDRHVLAAALKGGASTIVTFNLKDFPASLLSQYDVEAQHPDDFIDELMDLDMAAVLNAVRQQRGHLKRPPMFADEYLQMLLRQGLVQTVKKLQQYRDFI